jgi:hypothetical protein
VRQLREQQQLQQHEQLLAKTMAMMWHLGY